MRSLPGKRIRLLRMSARLLFFTLCALLLARGSVSVDRTREERAVGRDVVQAVVDIIRENCIFPEDRLYLRRLAYVESKDGLDPATFRQGFYGGIWQVKKTAFAGTSTCSGVLMEMCARIEENLGIHWQSVRWEDLMKPLYSGLAATLYVRSRSGSSIPGMIDSQALYWKTYYHDGQSTSTFTTKVNEMTDESCTKIKMDLVFIIDSSGSIGYLNFLRMLDFIKNVTDTFVLGPSDVQVAVVSFSDYAVSQFSLNTYTKHDELRTAIDNILYDSGGTDTADGIRLARRVFDPFYGGRSGTTKVGIVITDGQSNSFNETVHEAMLAKSEGVVLFALGIGSINREELENVASDPNCTHVNVLSGFSEIDSMLYEIKKAACRAPQVMTVDNTDGSNGTETGLTNKNKTITACITCISVIKFTDPVGPQNNSSNDTEISKVTSMNVTVNCGIVHVYTSYKTPHPGPAFYDIKETATDGNPLVLFLNKTSNGRPLYVTYVGKQLPKDAADLKKCNDSGYIVTITDKKEPVVDIVCREDGHERECTKTDFKLNEKYKSWICTSNTGQTGPIGISDKLPNPCTATAIKTNQLYHPYPYDETKFIRCDYQGKMYITMCPQGDTYHQGSHSCGSTAQTINNGDKTPLEPTLTNPCTAQAILNHQFFFTYTPDKTKFIHCDVWGHAWVLRCPSSLVWNQPGQTCVEDTHSNGNPCTQAQVDNGITMFPHPDKHKYIHCDNGLNPWVQSCVAQLVFDFASQNCVYPQNPFGR